MTRSWVGEVVVAVIGDRRIEVISGNQRVPAVNLDRLLSSAAVGWEGLLLEAHDSVIPAASINTPIVFAWNPRVQTKKMLGTEVLRSFNWAQEPYLFFLQAPTCLYW